MSAVRNLAASAAKAPPPKMLLPPVVVVVGLLEDAVPASFAACYVSVLKESWWSACVPEEIIVVCMCECVGGEPGRIMLPPTFSELEEKMEDEFMALRF